MGPYLRNNKEYKIHRQTRATGGFCGIGAAKGLIAQNVRFAWRDLSKEAWNN